MCNYGLEPLREQECRERCFDVIGHNKTKVLNVFFMPFFSGIINKCLLQVRLCEKRDVERWLTTKALKANGLWRLGKYDEALELCLDVQVCVVCALMLQS